MAQVVKRVLPFILTFVLGVGITAVVSRVSLSRRSCWGSRTWREFTNKHFKPIERRNYTFTVWEMPDSTTTIQIPIRVVDFHLVGLTMKEQALHFRAQESEADRRPDSTVSYVSPDAVDGLPVTTYVTISNIPRPVIADHRGNEGHTGCNTMVRVDLHSSGKVSRVEHVLSYSDRCPNIRDTLDAAKRISFKPALRNGTPVTQRISIMYSHTK